MNSVIINFVLFQAGWFACVLGGASNKPWLGAMLAVLIIGWHLWRAHLRMAEIKLISIAVVIGALWDSLLVWKGLLSYPSGMLLPFAAPYWIIIMWALFATTLNVSLRWLKDRMLVAIAFGGIGGPLAYYAGERLGAVQFLDTESALLALIIGWAIFTPLLMTFANRYNGFPAMRTSS